MRLAGVSGMVTGDAPFFHCSYSNRPRGLCKRLLSPVSLSFLTVANVRPTYPSPKPTLTLTSHLGQHAGLREG